MAIYKRFSTNFISAFWVVMIAVTWLAFAPTQAGGTASYIIVIGNSMEPGFHIGDLVIIHQAPLYQIGDAVVYRNLELSNFVFHRIISQELDRYTLQGDNNSWTDTYQPSREEVLGKLWLHIPRGGVYIQKIRNPLSMALIAGILGGIFATGLFIGKSKGNKRMHKKSIQESFTSIKQKIRSWLLNTTSSEAHGTSSSNYGNMLEGIFFALGLITLASFILGIIAYSRPASRIAEDTINYEHLGIFSYLASAPAGVYDANSIKSGDPIFTKLTCSVDVNFQYTLIAQQAKNIAGTHQLTAIISEPVSGWQRMVALEEETAFSGNGFSTSAKLNFCEIESLTQSMEAGTDFHPGSYTLSIIPNIKINGEIIGRALESTFDPSLAFRYDRVHFYLERDEEQGNLFSLAEAGTLSKEQKVANTILLFGADVAIPALRLVALFGLAIALGGMLALGLRLQNLSKSNQERFIRMRYDSLVIDVQDATAISSSNVIDVTSIDHLAKLAERFNAMILHEVNENGHVYFVKGEGTTYRLMVNADKTESAIPESKTQSQQGEA